jgi:hypothetical protein
MSSLVHSGILVNSPTLVDLSLSTIEIFKSIVVQNHCPLPLKKAFSFLVCSLLLRQTDDQAIQNSDILQVSSDLLTKLSGKALSTGKSPIRLILVALKLFAPLLPMRKELSESFLKGLLALNTSSLYSLLGYTDSLDGKDSGLIHWDLPYILKALPVEKTITPFLTIGIVATLSQSIVFSK